MYVGGEKNPGEGRKKTQVCVGRALAVARKPMTLKKKEQGPCQGKEKPNQRRTAPRIEIARTLLEVVFQKIDHPFVRGGFDGWDDPIRWLGRWLGRCAGGSGASSSSTPWTPGAPRPGGRATGCGTPSPAPCRASARTPTPRGQTRRFVCCVLSTKSEGKMGRKIS